MRPIQRVCLVSISGLALALLGTGSAATQGATPVTDPTTSGQPECRVEPRSEQDLLGLFAEVTPGAETAPALPVAPPEGEPADEETAAAVTTAVQQIFACLDAGEPLRALALTTDAYVVRLVTTDPLPESEFRALLEATPPAATAPEQASPVVRGVWVLPDGRAGAVVVVDDPDVPAEGEAAEFWIFTRVADRWLLDEVIASLAEGAVPGRTVAATPAP